jgi:hypothetical protein
MIHFVTEKTRARRLRGSVDLILALPLLLLLAWGTSLLSHLLIRQSRLQQASWVYAIAKVHSRVNDEDAHSMSRSTAGAEPGEYHLESKTECSLWESLSASSVSALPSSFRLAVLSACPSRHDLRLHVTLPDVIRRLGGETGLARSEMSVPFRLPGDDFRGSRTVRQALWQEAMLAAGFGALPLQLLGVPELASVAGVDLGGAAEAVLQQWGGIP